MKQKRVIAPRRTHKQYKTFVRAWQTSDTIEQVAKKTGLTEKKVKYTASIAKNRGVKLKKLSWVNNKVNWAELKEIAAKYN